MAILTTLQADVIHSITRFQRCRQHPPFNPKNPILKKARCVFSTRCDVTCSAQSADFICLIYFLTRWPCLPLLGFFQAMWRLFSLPSCQHHYTTGRPGHQISWRVNILETADSLEARRAKQIDYALQHTIPAGSASAHMSIGVCLSLCAPSIVSTY